MTTAKKWTKIYYKKKERMSFSTKKKILAIFMSVVLLAGGCYFMASALIDSNLIAQRESSGSEGVLKGQGAIFLPH